MSAGSSKRLFLRGALIGALVRIFWGVLGFVFWGGRNSWLTDLFYDAIYVTCPPWLIPIPDRGVLGGVLGDLVTSTVNAVLYGTVFVAAGAVRKMFVPAR
jgi:hypothetical protein